jgi:hypothetical protein
MQNQSTSAADPIDLRRPNSRPLPGMIFISLQAFFRVPIDTEPIPHSPRKRDIYFPKAKGSLFNHLSNMFNAAKG